MGADCDQVASFVLAQKMLLLGMEEVIRPRVRHRNWRSLQLVRAPSGRMVWRRGITTLSRRPSSSTMAPNGSCRIRRASHFSGRGVAAHRLTPSGVRVIMGCSSDPARTLLPFRQRRVGCQHQRHNREWADSRILRQSGRYLGRRTRKRGWPWCRHHYRGE